MVDRSSLTDRLRSKALLPLCPYDQRSPDYWSTPDDDPCKICGQINDLNAPDVCRGADTRVMDEAADEIEALRFFCALLMACGDREDLVDEVSICRTVLGIEVERAERAEARAEKAEASLVEAMGALKGWAVCVDPDDPRPDDTWVNLKAQLGDFRRASDVHSRLLEGVSGEGGLSRSQPCRDAQERSHDQQHFDGGRG